MYEGNRSNADAFDYVKEAKLGMTAERLCSNASELILPFVTEVFGYKFDEQPDYSKLKFSLSKFLLTFELYPDLYFDWTKRKNRGLRKQQARRSIVIIRPGDENVGDQASEHDSVFGKQSS